MAKRPTATRREVLDRIAALGATYEEQSGGWDEFNVQAPAGYVWAESYDIHELVNTYRPGPWGKAGFWAEVLSRMASGIAPCEIEDCEWCADTTRATR